LLGKELDIRLNSRVKKIDYSSNKSIVEVNGEKIESDYVIVAVPLGVLKNNSIEFVPKMSSQKQVALRNTNMGVVNKFLLIWDTSFWNTNLQYIGYTPDTKGKFNYYMNMLKFLPNTNGLMTFAFGNYALETEKMTDEEIIKEVMDELKIIYGKNIPNPTKLLRTQWGQNINSFGSYSYATNGTTSDDFDILSTEINNKIFFAGEHTSKEFRGTVHGAYLSGIREANKILAL
jgi:monoamine oxidase